MWTVRLLVRSLPFQGSQVGFESHTVYQKLLTVGQRLVTSFGAKTM